VKRVLLVVGTRPNFIKITQFPKEFAKYPLLDLHIVHTGQHFDDKMSTIFFEQFGFKPDTFLNVEQGSPNSQIANIMLGIEKTIYSYKPDLVVVVGDVNSTFAAAFTANKMGVKIAHVESGLRSNDRTMPEEFNRILTDEVANLFFVTEKSGYDNLVKEGKSARNIHFVGNTMIDTMVAFKNNIEESDVLSRYSLESKKYVLMTMHRPATVDNKEGLLKLIELVEHTSAKYKVVFPIHPRTVKNMKEFGLEKSFSENANLILTDPLDYFSFQKLVKYANFILTDSGGIQEESTFLKVPCLTFRPNTERPITISLGTNELLPFDMEEIKRHINLIEINAFKEGEIPPFWDGRSTERIVKVISETI